MVYYVRGSEGEKVRGGEDLMSGEYGLEIMQFNKFRTPHRENHFFVQQAEKAVIEKGDLF
jgi:hypothetical protein